MKKQTLIAGLAVATLGLGTAAWAGVKLTVPVAIDLSNRYAIGSLGAARASADTKQYIGVSTTIYAGGEAASVFAQDSSGTYVSCYSYRPSFVAAARALASDSYIHFAWDALGECTELSVYTVSYYDPKTP
ncbi:hypothetical protein D7Y13_29590 [Corallococcus praedator]|uniref:Uncharacterized protein n=1 Tax=Corallococcus praedator TaxID=2316724 RepID=A0ABX9QAQ5_9BACT|nr:MULTISPECIES: hypothetical protein [Corallococcus]RKH20348.1 hypothetical protein D7X74_04340 [Corallococcus sp. CA047B]RKH30271.1 hypothetical protein D7X75_21300 [Corallococcus sp. CA031C]RKH97823.1 hypothetical protein D7Y13_29590 [Corallococcus praedator]